MMFKYFSGYAFQSFRKSGFKSGDTLLISGKSAGILLGTCTGFRRCCRWTTKTFFTTKLTKGHEVLKRVEYYFFRSASLTCGGARACFVVNPYSRKLFTDRIYKIYTDIFKPLNRTNLHRFFSLNFDWAFWWGKPPPYLSGCPYAVCDTQYALRTKNAVSRRLFWNSLDLLCEYSYNT